MARSHRMTPKRRAALRKAQAASARKRRGEGKGKLAAANRRYDKTNNRIKKVAKIGAIAAAAGAVAYGAYQGRNVTRRHVVKKAENNPQVRQRVASQLLNARRGKKRLPQTGLRLHKRYRMGHPAARRRRKAAKYG